MGERQENQIQTRFESRDEGLIAWLIVNNPARLNSMNSALMGEFVAAVNELSAQDDLRAIVLTGAGDKAFIGGADIGEMGEIDGPDQARAFITRVHRCCQALRDAPVPVIGRINGYCFGAGLEIAAACDLRVATDGAVFGMPEVKLGIPSVVEAALLPMLIGWGRTRHMLLLGENFSAAEAFSIGLVERVAPADELDQAVEHWIAQLLTSAPQAVRLQKALIRKWEDLPLRAAICAGIDSFAAAFEGDEPRAAMADFLTRQKARKARQS